MNREEPWNVGKTDSVDHRSVDIPRIQLVNAISTTFGMGRTTHDLIDDRAWALDERAFDERNTLNSRSRFGDVHGRAISPTRAPTMAKDSESHVRLAHVHRETISCRTLEFADTFCTTWAVSL
ncbi:hypothetical protein EAG_07811 [Camponotus floridanus]|uniref:Uncharacterized protein n=1 Tax=Camponotus floridanus TaxID=104421 RepID=E2AC50_CAMFO|nr:hypothetical protein EAG_07811 [Camponotus floridanus]